MDLLFDTIIVPQGAEYQAVRRGLKLINSSSLPTVLSIPIGVESVTQYLATSGWQPANQAKILVMGLCGSLSSQYQVGDIVLYRNCLFTSSSSLPSQSTDLQLTTSINTHLPKKIPLVTALTSDRLIWSAQEKQNLGKQYQASVVDMEGFALLDALQSQNVRVAMLRVVSDSARDNIPNLQNAIDSQGKLQPIPMAIAMVQQPLAATRLITGSLKGLKILQQITAELFRENRVV